MSNIRDDAAEYVCSRLMQWPCKITQISSHAPFLDGAELLLAADCTAYAYAKLHTEFMKGRITLVGCPKEIGAGYEEKLSEILKENDVKGITLIKMDTPCCSAFDKKVKGAIAKSKRDVPFKTVTITTDGKILKTSKKPCF
jgi:hypothetical protein